MMRNNKSTQKVYYIILDGAADRPIEVLGNKTPLEAATTPNIDKLCKNGMMSLIDIIPGGITPETDSGLLALLGYDPEKYYFGRGSLEAMGLGICNEYRYKAGFRVNFASSNPQTGLLDRRTSRNLTKAELQELTTELKANVNLNSFGDVQFDLVSFGVHRGILVFFSNSLPLSGNVSNTDPLFEKIGYFSVPRLDYNYSDARICIPLDDSLASKTTASLVNSFVEQSTIILNNSKVNASRKKKGELPCNLLIVRDGGGEPPVFPKFYDKYNSNLVIYGELPCENALAQLVGAEYVYTKEFELQLDDSFLKEMGHIMINSSKDVVFCHLKGPDEPGHDNKPFQKILAIEKIDRFLFKELLKSEQGDSIFIITCDHATPCELGIHSNDKVPLLISGKGICKDGSVHFDEKTASRGKCPVKKASEVMNFVRKLKQN